ncbi:lysozyme inhibitor LprI family protein [Metabacillus halosaccharovorans]|uniref:lysozyme inhibitor LprI family protein n=1 Tax=Metabacillus halosaccharovorans TaxID=930124 RepID=UPI0009950FC6|nr:lysozyme inhibitor LprI family protein [Metabacillus halosaccharovorans]
MISSRIYLIVSITVGLGLLTACGESSVESNAKSSNNNSALNADSDLTNKDERKTENSFDEKNGKNQLEEQGGMSKKASTSNEDGEPLKSDNTSNEVMESKKDVYLKKLNEMEESDRYTEAKTTMVEMEEQEVERYKKWDKELNEIYGVLKDQLDTGQMGEIRKQQRDWVTHRDEAAKVASLKYEGGSTESLEYVATQATLTRERCYELVAKYMK